MSEAPQPIEVTVKLFAAFQDAYGVPEIMMRLPAGTPVSAVCDRIIEEHPELERWRSLTRFGINLDFAKPATPLHHGDEVVLIPPVSGG